MTTHLFEIAKESDKTLRRSTEVLPSKQTIPASMPRIRTIWLLLALASIGQSVHGWGSTTPSRTQPSRLHQQPDTPHSTSGHHDAIPSLPQLLLPHEKCQVDRLSGTDLAYIGDVVYELFIRSRTVWPPKRTSDLQNQVVAVVRGKSNF